MLPVTGVTGDIFCSIFVDDIVVVSPPPPPSPVGSVVLITERKEKNTDTRLIEDFLVLYPVQRQLPPLRQRSHWMSAKMWKKKEKKNTRFTVHSSRTIR